MNEWIRIEERVPDHCDDVLVYHDAREEGFHPDDDFMERPIFVGNYILNEGIFMTQRSDLDLGKVTHWMPLPEPPESL
jgi:hypothetical protein